jgi:hypothetical protein
MNIDLLKDNPDWRWIILVVLVAMALTIYGWTTFEYIAAQTEQLTRMIRQESERNTGC